MTLLGIDIGTTHCKAGLFRLDGETIQIASRPTVTQSESAANGGSSSFDPQTLWQTTAAVIREVVSNTHDPIRAIGISSMAESGLLIDRQSGSARSPIIPWFDTAAQVQANRIAGATDAQAFYISSGLWANYKCSLAKILWLREQDRTISDGVIWLSVADYVAYRLTGAFGTDYSLAGRTGAFEISSKQWNTALLRQFDLSAELFPPAALSGTPIGTTGRLVETGLPAGIPVAVSGHDHICAALGANAIEKGIVFDSMGTAEVLTGTFPERPLTNSDFESGLLSGCHVVPERGYWLGSLSTSGGAVEWLRGVLSDKPLSYDALFALAATADPAPTGILFFPYLLGSGAPNSDPLASGAWIGLRRDHTRADVAKAVLEGTAYEMELIRLAGESMTGQPIMLLTAAGGGARNHSWLQIKADVSGVPIRVCAEPEAALLGAAVAAGIGAGSYADLADALTAVAQPASSMIEPDGERHGRYTTLFEQGYLPLQAPLHQFGQIG